jgi:nicotianamine synthase
MIYVKRYVPFAPPQKASWNYTGRIGCCEKLMNVVHLQSLIICHVALNMTSDSTTDLLHTFPYYQNYVDLTRLECSTLEAFLLSAPRRIAFIGSGPLPLTSMCMFDRYVDATVVNIDRDEAALMISSELCAILGYGARMSFACEDVSLPRKQGPDWEVFDVVFLAALVGTSREDKVEILEGLVGRLKPGTLVVARSAQGLRSVLYPVSFVVAIMIAVG